MVKSLNAWNAANKAFWSAGAQDAQGHKPAGSPEGGQFTGSGASSAHSSSGSTHFKSSPNFVKKDPPLSAAKISELETEWRAALKSTRADMEKAEKKYGDVGKFPHGLYGKLKHEEELADQLGRRVHNEKLKAAKANLPTGAKPGTLQQMLKRSGR